MFTKALCLFLLLETVVLSSFAKPREDRPNILWIVSEDTSPAMGCYGDKFATTPFIDKLATQGVLYENAFSTAPVCAPSRFTLITGMFASSMGTENMRSTFPIPKFVKFFPRYLREAGYYTTNNAKKDYNTVDQRMAWDESSTEATYKNRKPGQPFFAVFNLGITHESKIHVKKTKLKHDPKKVPMPPYHPRTPEMEHDWALFYDNVQEMDTQAAKLVEELEAAGLAENTIVFYYSDHGGVIARSKRFIFDSGLRVPLIIRFPEKYAGLAPGKPGSRIERLVSFEDFAPTILNLAGVQVPGYMEGKPFLGKEVGTEKEYAFAFRGRIDERTDFVTSIRDKKFRYVKNYMPQKVYGQHVEYQWQAPSIASWDRAFRAGGLDAVQSAFWKPKPSEELYEISTDPYNINNLAGKKEYAAVLAKMRSDLGAIILKHKDTGFIPEAMKAEISKTGTIYDYVRSGNYPLDKILRIADMASSRDAGFVKNLAAGFVDKNPLIRYWAANGCVVLGNKAVAERAGLAKLLSDPEPVVRLAAAEALYGAGEKIKILPILTSALESDNIDVRVQALTVLEIMKGDAKPAASAIRKMKEARADKKLAAAPLWQSGHDVNIATGILSAFGS